MDTSTVLEKYTQDLSNLPLEVRHLLEEIKAKDAQIMEARKRYQLKDNQIHKFIRANGTLTKHPKEPQLYQKIEEDMEVAIRLQKEKIVLSNTALFLVSKYLFNFETDIAKLERDELLPKVENIWADDNAVSSATGGSLYNRDGYSDLSGSSTPRPSTTGGTPVSEFKKASAQRRRPGMRGSMGAYGSVSRLTKRLKSEDSEDRMDEDGYDFGVGSVNLSLGATNNADGMPNAGGEDADNNLYCFCQRVSFGEMIGCDNDDCKYEWFHWSCVGITSPPKDDDIWYCPDCAPKMEKRKKKKK